jgi:hypothetical protein
MFRELTFWKIFIIFICKDGNMKKLFCLILFILVLTGAAFAQIVRGGTAWISVKTANIKSGTGFFASSRGTMAYADQVTILQVSGNWAEVRSKADSALSGWTALSNLSARRIVASGTGASASEIALAGKGFNQEVENSYKSSGKFNYAEVDKTEAIKVSRDELHKFVTEGRLLTGE